jgi:ADP-heptose:LPS heptosyltransferase
VTVLDTHERAGPGGTAVVVRLDNDGDVLLAGPAVRAVARGSDRVVLLVSPRGRQAATLLPGVDDVVVHDPAWSGYEPPPVDPGEFARAVAAVAATGADRGVVLTSFHQSPLPAALLLRLAGVGHVTATSEDYPGSLLTVRHRLDHPHDPAAGGRHEVERALATVAAAGYPVAGDPRGDALAVTLPAGTGPEVATRLPAPGHVVVHPGASVPARAPSPEVARRWVAALADAGHSVVVTGSAADAPLTARVAGGRAVDLGGLTSFRDLAVVLARAAAVVVGNTGPAHLAAAVGTPVVSAFSPVVPWTAWRPWRVPVRRLGERSAACAGTRARTCPVPGHPCLDGVSGEQVVAAVADLAAGGRDGRAA